MTDNHSMVSAATVKMIQKKYEGLIHEFDERSRRLWAATEASALGHGGVAAVSRATGLSEGTIRSGRRELLENKRRTATKASYSRRVRQAGAGRKGVTEHDPDLVGALDALVEPTTRGDPMSSLRWTAKSTRNLAEELARQGHEVSHTKVGQLLREMDYSLQSTRKKKEGTSHPDRDAQFKYINRQVKSFQRDGQPVVSVDAKKKELIGDFANSGREYQPKGQPEPVRTHDFEIKELGKGIPYGLYDPTMNNGWVSVGIDHDTAQFAVATVRCWWRRMGSKTYRKARQLLITADSGGSNSARSRLWKYELQRFVDDTGLRVTVCHFPPGTSKWNKIEHRMFSHITENWRGRPLLSHTVIVNLIGNTKTRAGLRIRARLDTGSYPLGVKISDEEIEQLNMKPARFHGEWNYRILPR